MQERSILSFCLLVGLSFVGITACQHSDQGASLQGQGADESGFRLLWEANSKRCTQKSGEKKDEVYFSACRRFEMQTPLYNQRDKPRPVSIQLRFNCEAEGELQLEIALAKSPVLVSQQGEKLEITNAWQRESVKSQKGVALQQIRLEIPPREKAMFVAMLDPFKAQSVKAGCQISYRVDLAKNL